MSDIEGHAGLSPEIGQAVEAFSEAIREPHLILDQNHNIISANESFCSEFLQNAEEIKGKKIFELNSNFAALEGLFSAENDEAGNKNNLKLDLSINGAGKRKVIARIAGLPLEGIDLNLLTFEKVQKEDIQDHHLKSFEDILSQAPAAICVLRGPNHKIELANQNYLKLIGNRNILGKTVKEALPEIEGQGFFEILDKVYTSGEIFTGNEVPVKLDTKDGSLRNSFINFMYQPTFDSNGKVDGIFVHAIEVTEQVNARKEVEKNEEKLKILIDAVPVIIWITDAVGNCTYLNSNWYNYTGQKKADAKQLEWLNLVHPEDRERVNERFQVSISQKDYFSHTYRLRTKNGNYRWVIDKGTPKYSPTGEYEGMVGSVLDIHEEKIKKQLIREKEHRTRNIVEEATVATAVYAGKDMKIELANDAMIRLWGKNRSVVGKKLRDALPELEGQPFHGLLEQVFTTGQTYWGKEDRVDLEIDGKMQTGYFNFTYKPLRNENGEIYGILNMALDVTEMVKSKNLLRESESHFRQMADLMPNKVTNTDAEGNFVYFNQNWINFTGLSSDQLKDLGWSGFIHPEEKTEYVHRWQNSLKTGNNFEMELRLLDKNGEYQWHLSRAEAVKDETGKVQMWIGSNTEIQKLKEEEKRKEDFLKMVSHELKTPVTSIKGYVQLLLSLLKKEQEPQKIAALPLQPSLQRIDYQLIRLTRLISEILDLSRIEENKLELNKESFSLNKLIEETVQDINYTNTQHKISVEHSLKCDIFADRDRIGQVLINFITNAIKYSPESQKVEITVEEFAEKKVKVRVKDYGIGIDKKYHSNIFKRFYRIDGKNEDTYSGFGIGLFLANEIIQRHNGSIDVTSEKGKGSEFSFILDVV